MTKGLLKSCNKKLKLYKTYCKYKSDDNKTRYIKYKNKLKSLLRKAEKDFYCNKFNKISGNIRQTWSLINSLLNKKGSTALNDNFIIEGIKVENKEEIAEQFNKYFVNIGSGLASKIEPVQTPYASFLDKPTSSSFSLFLTTADEIKNIVLGFDNKTSAGFDDISVNLMKSSINCIAEPLSQIINCSFTNGIVPDKLKIGKVCPIFKGGNKNLITNYTPIAVLPSFSKIFEKAVHSRLTSFLSLNNVISDNQFGFRSHHSTCMAVLNMCDNISKSIDKNEFAIGVFIDLAKAFDSLDHNILLNKLNHYGVRGITLSWFESYLSDRFQYVNWNECSSSIKPIHFGIPQGSILGPLLFIIYINDIVKCSNVLKFILFADDTNLFHSDSDFQQLILTVNIELQKLSVWLKANKLSLNVTKTHYILFGRKHIPPNSNTQLYIDYQIIDKTESTKFLGVHIDNKLNWSVHINHISLKLSQGLGILNKMRNIFPRRVLLTMYYSLFYPYLTYCSVIWACAKPTLLNKIEVLQNKAIRLITNSGYRAHTTVLYKELNVLKLYDVYLKQVLIFMFKVKNKLLPLSCLQYFKINDNRNYVTRNSNFFLHPPFRTDIRQQCIVVSGPRLWDSLKSNLQCDASISMLKKSIDNYLLNKYN